MAIFFSNNNSPKSGEEFFFTVEGRGIVKTTIHVRKNVIFEHECPDPPCHEVCRIPFGSEGETLIVDISSDTGEKLQKQFRIEGLLAESGGGSTLTRSR